jgi:hypothetical protein
MHPGHLVQPVVVVELQRLVQTAQAQRLVVLAALHTT